MTHQTESIDYRGFRIAVLSEKEGYVAWAERADRGLIDAGYASARKVGTVAFDEPAAALAEAKRFIDMGQWTPNQND